MGTSLCLSQLLLELQSPEMAPASCPPPDLMGCVWGGGALPGSRAASASLLVPRGFHPPVRLLRTPGTGLW